MIILDTNVISAVMERSGHEEVVAWLDRQSIDDLCTTTLTLHELRFGIEKKMQGRRRRALEEGLRYALELLAHRVWPLDEVSAMRSGELQARQEKIGRPIPLGDCLIAGIALARGAVVATRNVRHFENLGLSIENPWEPGR